MQEDDPNLEAMFKQMDEMDKMFDFQFAQSQEEIDEMFAAMDEQFDAMMNMKMREPIAPQPVEEKPTLVDASTQTENNEDAFLCDSNVNFITDARYEQEAVCGSLDEVIASCQQECLKRGCKAMFYQEHNNNLGCPESPAGGW